MRLLHDLAIIEDGPAAADPDAIDPAVLGLLNAVRLAWNISRIRRIRRSSAFETGADRKL